MCSGATRLRLTTQVNGFGVRRQFSVFNEFSNKIKGEASKYGFFLLSLSLVIYILRLLEILILTSFYV